MQKSFCFLGSLPSPSCLVEVRIFRETTHYTFQHPAVKRPIIHFNIRLKKPRTQIYMDLKVQCIEKSEGYGGRSRDTGAVRGRTRVCGHVHRHLSSNCGHSSRFDNTGDTETAWGAWGGSGQAWRQISSAHRVVTTRRAHRRIAAPWYPRRWWWGGRRAGGRRVYECKYSGTSTRPNMPKKNSLQTCE